MPLTLAFYRGEGDRLDRLIRAWTGGLYSHVELLEAWMPPPATLTAISASWRDGGVRQRPIRFAPGRWDFAGVAWAPADALERARAETGKGYDLAGIALTQVLNLRRHRTERWFCSELVAHALGLPDPHRYSPQDLWCAVRFLDELTARPARAT